MMSNMAIVKCELNPVIYKNGAHAQDTGRITDMMIREALSACRQAIVDRGMVPGEAKVQITVIVKPA